MIRIGDLVAVENWTGSVFEVVGITGGLFEVRCVDAPTLTGRVPAEVLTRLPAPTLADTRHADGAWAWQAAQETPGQ